jgi:CSLREA domain-containing protein
MKLRAVSVAFLTLLFLGLLGALGSASTAEADTVITVTTFNDEIVDNGVCSLREAVRSANLNTAIGGCPAGTGADTIMLSPGTYSLAITRTSPFVDENAAASGDLDITSTVTIGVSGSGTAVIEGGAGWNDRVLDVGPSAAGINVTISNVTIQNGLISGFTDGDGAGLLNHSGVTLSLANSAIVSNSVTATSFSSTGGGGLFNETG